MYLRSHILNISYMSLCCPSLHLQPPPGERKIYLLIEGPTENSVKRAKQVCKWLAWLQQVVSCYCSMPQSGWGINATCSQIGASRPHTARLVGISRPHAGVLALTSCCPALDPLAKIEASLRVVPPAPPLLSASTPSSLLRIAKNSCIWWLVVLQAMSPAKFFRKTTNHQQPPSHHL
jgi:hypothetical protein